MAPLTSLVPQQNLEPRCSLERPEHLSHTPRANSRPGAIWWHYGRGERETMSCAGYPLGRGYQLRLVAPGGHDDVRRFASAVALLNRHALIERELIADGWHLVRFTHQISSQARPHVSMAHPRAWSR